MADIIFLTNQHQFNWFFIKKQNDNNNNHLCIGCYNPTTNESKTYKFINYKNKNCKIEDCSICLEPINEINENENTSNLTDCYVTECGHSFHKGCMALFLIMDNYDNCPICRNFISSHKS